MFTPRRWAGAALVLAAVALAPLSPAPGFPQKGQSRDVELRSLKRLALPAQESLQYSAEWRLVNAGNLRMRWGDAQAVDPTSAWAIDLTLKSAGLVEALYKIENQYTSRMNDALCANVAELIAHEGKKHRRVLSTYDRDAGKAYYLERDLETEKVLKQESVEIPPCVHDVIGGLYRLRSTALEPGTATQIPISDGKKTVSARVEAQEIERIRTPLREFETVRYEVFLFKGVFYRRDARMFVWISNDDRRLPVQIQIRMRFYIGTVTIQLSGEERA